MSVTLVRRNRALTIFGLAGVAMLVGGAIYLRPSLTAPTVDRVPASSGVIAGSLGVSHSGMPTTAQYR